MKTFLTLSIGLLVVSVATGELNQAMLWGLISVAWFGTIRIAEPNLKGRER